MINDAYDLNNISYFKADQLKQRNNNIINTNIDYNISNIHHDMANNTFNMSLM